MTTRLAVAAASGLLVLAGGAPAAQICFGPPTGGGPMTNLHCEAPGPNYDEGWQGFGTTAPEACLVGDECGTIDGPTVWSLSRSISSPHENVGALPQGTSTLYLWLQCCYYGLAEATFSLSGDIDVLSLTPLNGFTNAGALPDVHLQVTGCPLGPVPAARLEVQPTAPTSVDGPGSSSWGRVKAQYSGT